jgi:hypothetical protein
MMEPRADARRNNIATFTLPKNTTCINACRHAANSVERDVQECSHLVPLTEIVPHVPQPFRKLNEFPF